MCTPSPKRSSCLVVCAAALVTAAWSAACDAPATTLPQPASPSGSPESSAAQGGQSGVCDRTWQVRDEIMDVVGKDDCTEVTDEDLAEVSYLSLVWYGFDIDGESSENCEVTDSHELGAGPDGTVGRSRFTTGKFACPSIPPSRPRSTAAAATDTTRITALKEGDLDGLTNLWYLSFEGHALKALPDGIFDDLGNLTRLSLSLNLFRTLPDSVFDELTSLRELDLSGNLLTQLPEHIFDELGSLESLDLLLNNLRKLPAGIFDRLENLDFLDLRANRFTELPAGVFDELGDLSSLWLDYNRINKLPQGVFDELGSLAVLWMDYNGLAELPDGAFGALGNLRELTLTGNNLTELPGNAFEGLGNLWGLLLDRNRLGEIPAGAFEGLVDLRGMELSFNRLDTLSDGIFDGLVNLDELYLNHNQLAGIPRGVFDGLDDLSLLVLSYNQLDTLRGGVFDGLDNLQELYLFDNELTGISGDAFDGLDDLAYLVLSFNELRSLPEGVFDGLDNLRVLYLFDNRLSQLPGGIFDDLGDLEVLVLAQNGLTALPEGIFNDLDDLRGLNLRDNRLLALPPGLFAGVDDLEAVWLHENPGAPFPLQLELKRTDSTDPMAPGPATVEVRVTEGAPFEVEIGLVARGGSLDDSEVSISTGDTASRSVIASAEASAAHSLAIDTIWDDLSYFDEDDYLGFEFVAGGPLVLANPDEVTVRVPAAYLTQGAQSLNGGVPLVAGRQALLRVFATADVDNDFEPQARATFYSGNATIHVDLEPPAVIPRAVDESRLDASFTGIVPATAIQPGVEMVVELDRTGVIPATDGSQLRMPATGRMALDVVQLDTFDLKIVPIAFGSDASGRNDRVASLAADMAGNDSRGVLRPTRTLLPIAEMEVTARERYVTWADTLPDGILALLNELQMLRHAEAGDTDQYYHGLFALPATRHPEYWDFLGVAYIAGWSALTLSHDADGRYHPEVAVTFAHELGHNLGLRHAPCGYPDDVDPRYPYPEGSIGVWGYAFGADGGPGRLLNPDGYRDLMSYCEPAGISDFSFTSALDYRDAISAAAMARRPAAARQTLLLWGSIRDGEPRLEPVFEWTAPVKLPESPGPYRLVGADASGRSLFQLSFSPDETGDGDMGFLFAIEADEDWAATLATVTLAGPVGSSVVDGSRRGAIVTDRATGRIVSIARDWDGVLNRDGAFPRVLGSRGDVVIHRSLPRPG